MTHREAIERLSNLYRVIALDGLGEYNDNVRHNMAIDLAIEALKAQEPRVMTLDEACAAELCWIEVRAINYVSAADIVFDPAIADRVDIYRPGMPDSQLGIDLYGEVWRCWTSRPTDKQREAEPWQGH